MKRPIGVTVIAVLAIISAVILLLGSLSYLGVGGLFAAFGTTAGVVAGGVAVAFGIYMLLMGAVQLAFGVGALQLRTWAWTLGIALFAIALAVSIVQMLIAGFTASLVVSALIDLAVLGYLYTGEVRHAFGHDHVTRHTTPTTPSPTH